MAGREWWEMRMATQEKGIQGMIKGGKSGGGGSSTGFWRGKYDPQQFIVPGQDQNGNSVRVFCRIVPLLDRSVDIIMGSRKFPFKSKGDLLRWCIKSGVERLEDMEPMQDSVTAQVDAMMTILADEQAHHEFSTLFQTMATTIGMHVQAQAIGEARRVVSLMQQHVGRMRAGYWRDRYSKEISEKFGYLLKSGNVQGVGLGEAEDHGDSGVVDEGETEE